MKHTVAEQLGAFVVPLSIASRTARHAFVRLDRQTRSSFDQSQLLPDRLAVSR